MTATNELELLQSDLHSDQEKPEAKNVISEAPCASNSEPLTTSAEEILKVISGILTKPADELDEGLLGDLQDILVEGQEKGWAEFEDFDDETDNISTTLRVEIT